MQSLVMVGLVSGITVRGTGSRLIVGQPGGVTPLQMGVFSRFPHELSISEGAVVDVQGDGRVTMSGLGDLIPSSDTSNVRGATIFVGEGGPSGILRASVLTGLSTFRLGQNSQSGDAAYSIPDVFFNHTDTHVFAPLMSGNIVVTKVGSGTTIFTADNQQITTPPSRVDPNLLHRDVFVGGGTLQVGDNGSTGRLAGNDARVSILAGEIVAWRSNHDDWRYVIDGVGSLRKRGGASLRLSTSMSGASTFSGGVNLDEGTLELAGNAVAGTGAIRAQAGTTLALLDGVSVGNAVSLLGAPVDLRVGSGSALLTGVVAEVGASRSIRKVGAGSLTLAASNNFTGGASLEAGVLRADHQSALGSGLITNNNATLELSLGATTATTLNVFSYSQAPTAALTTSVSGVGCVAKRLQVGDLAQIGGTLNVNFDGGCVPANGQSFTIVNAANGVSGTFANVNITGVAPVVSFATSYTANSVIITATAPAICAPGNFSTTGYAPCTPAEPGNFVALAGATAQTACAAGSYQPAAGQTTCILASAGSFVGSAGATTQTLCTAGSFSATTGATACTLAAINFFVPTSGATSQTPCPANTFSATPGAIACTSSVQTITFAPASPVNLGVAPITLTATASSGLTAFTFATTSVNTICTVSGNLLTIVGVGTCALTATQPGNANYQSASASANVVINQGTQTVSFAPTTPVNFGVAPITLTATASSGLTTFTFATTSANTICTVAGNQLTIVGVGSCALTATQPGDANYASASANANVAINAVAPGAPTIGAGSPGNAQATIGFTPPSFTGGVTISSYTVSCVNGANTFTNSGSASPITVTGLSNGTAYDCSVVATNVVGSSAPSAAVSVTPSFRSYTGASPTGSGTITASFTGGGAACSYSIAQYIPLTGHPRSPPAGSAPSQFSFPFGLFDFTTSGCTPGSTITMTIAYPGSLPANTQYWKYGPHPGNPTPSWYVLPANFNGNSVTFTITDGQLGDDDLVANGTLVDQGGPGVPPPPTVPINALWLWALGLIITLLGSSQLRSYRPR
jgi:autotransporter-associated beta strand protein